MEKVRDSSTYPTPKLKQKKRYIIWYNKIEGDNYILFESCLTVISTRAIFSFFILIEKSNIVFMQIHTLFGNHLWCLF